MYESPNTYKMIMRDFCVPLPKITKQNSNSIKLCGIIDAFGGLVYLQTSVFNATKQFKPSNPETGKVVIKGLWDFDGHLEASVFMEDFPIAPSEKVEKRRCGNGCCLSCQVSKSAKNG